MSDYEHTADNDAPSGLHLCGGCGVELDADDRSDRCDECPIPPEGGYRRALAYADDIADLMSDAPEDTSVIPPAMGNGERGPA